jgi:hypothetical protein
MSKYLLYYSLVQSRLIYGIEFYGSASKADLHPIIIAQNRILKFLFSIPYKHSTFDTYNSLNVLPFYQLYSSRLFTIAHKAIHSKVCHFPTHLLELFSSPRQCLTIRLHHRKLFSKDILFNIFECWNYANVNTRSTVSLYHALKLFQVSNTPDT